ncbi:hypothetical protein D3C77_336870 [compost metagenome]
MPVMDCGVIGPLAMRSAPCTSLLSTLPVNVSCASVAGVVLRSSTAFGASSTMFTLIEPVALLPSVSVATTAKLSPRLVPLPVLCASLLSRV